MVTSRLPLDSSSTSNAQQRAEGAMRLYPESDALSCKGCGCFAMNVIARTKTPSMCIVSILVDAYEPHNAAHNLRDETGAHLARRLSNLRWAGDQQGA